MSDDELFDEVGAAVQARGGWRSAPPPTPGALPSWCLDPGGEVAVSVNVVDGVVVAYLPSADREIRLTGIDGLVEWLDTREGRTRPA
jgi:hypothetical protein